MRVLVQRKVGPRGGGVVGEIRVEVKRVPGRDLCILREKLKNAQFRTIDVATYVDVTVDKTLTYTLFCSAPFTSSDCASGTV